MITPTQLDQHLKAMKGKLNLWPGIPGAQCMVVFASINKLLGGPAYSAAGAKDLWNNTALSAGYTQLGASAAVRFGDIAVYGSTWGAGWGHVAVVVTDHGAAGLDAFGQNPAPAGTTRLSKAGLLGYLRPRNLGPATPPPAAAKPTAAPAALVNRKVTGPVAYARTAPRANAPLAPGYPQGIAKGSNIAVHGFVIGEDPYGSGDNAWYVTKSGFYVWANAAENTLKGLKQL